MRLGSARARVVAGAVVAVAVLGGVAVAVLVGGGGDETGSAPTRAPRAPADRSLDLRLSLGKVSVEGTGAGGSLDDAQARALLDTVTRYVTLATVDPLRSGKPAGDLSPVLGPAALARLSGPDRAVLVDEGLPRVRGRLSVVGAPVDLVGLADGNGNVALVAATLDLLVNGATSPRGPGLQVKRTGQLLLTPDAGGWKISGYDLDVSRSGAGVDVTTTTSQVPSTRR